MSLNIRYQIFAPSNYNFHRRSQMAVTSFHLSDCLTSGRKYVLTDSCIMAVSLSRLSRLSGDFEELSEYRAISLCISNIHLNKNPLYRLDIDISYIRIISGAVSFISPTSRAIPVGIPHVDRTPRQNLVSARDANFGLFSTTFVIGSGLSPPSPGTYIDS